MQLVEREGEEMASGSDAVVSTCHTVCLQPSSDSQVLAIDKVGGHRREVGVYR